MKQILVPFPELISERLLLRQTNKMDCKEILFLRSDEGMNKYINREPAKNIKDAEDFVDKITKGFENAKNVNWSITLKGDQTMRGSICLWNFSPDGKIAEVGYDLHPDYQNKGIMTEALQSVLAFGFEKLGLQQIEAFTSYKNEKSKQMLLRNGFSLKENRKDEGNPDNIIFEIKNQNTFVS